MNRAVRAVDGAGCDVAVGATVGRGVGVVEGVRNGVALAVGASVGEGAVGVAVTVGEAATARVGNGPSLITASPQGASYNDAASCGSSGAHAVSNSTNSRTLDQNREAARTALTHPALALE